MRRVIRETRRRHDVSREAQRAVLFAAALLSGCALAATPRYEVIGGEKIALVRVFEARGLDAAADLGRVLAQSLAGELQSRGILAPLLAADQTPPANATVLVSGWVERTSSGTLTAEASVVDLKRHRTLLERRFQQHASTLFGEAHALRRDAVGIGQKIAIAATVEVKTPEPTR